MNKIHLEEESANDRDRVIQPLLLLGLRQKGVFHEQTEPYNIQHLIKMFRFSFIPLECTFQSQGYYLYRDFQRRTKFC